MMRRLALRGVIVGAGLAAMAAGLFVGATACSLACEAEPIQNGSHEIIESPRVALVGSVVEISDDFVEVIFADADGNDWVVRYAIQDRD